MKKRGRGLEIVGTLDETYVPDVNLGFSVGPEVLPGLAKYALHAAALESSGWDRSGEAADAIREVLVGTAGRFPRRNVISWDFDQPDLISGVPFYSGYQVVACPEKGLLGARVHIYGLLRIRVLLTNGYRGECHRVVTSHREPFTGTESRVEGECRQHPLPSLWAGISWRLPPSMRMTDYFSRHRRLVTAENFTEQGAPTYIEESHRSR